MTVQVLSSVRMYSIGSLTGVAILFVSLAVSGQGKHVEYGSGNIAQSGGRNIMHTKYVSDETYSSETLVNMLARGHHFGPLDGVPADFECAWRKAAYVYASTKLLTSMTTKQKSDAFDSLELSTLCGENFSAVPDSAGRGMTKFSRNDTDKTKTFDNSVVVLEVSTVEELLLALNTIANYSRTEAGRNDVGHLLHRVQMAPGVYRLASPMFLGPEHSNTVIEAPSGGVTISGNRLINVTWSKYTTKRGIAVSAASVPADIGVIDSLRVNGDRATRARYPNADPVRDVYPTGWITGKSVFVNCWSHFALEYIRIFDLFIIASKTVELKYQWKYNHDIRGHMYAT